MEVPIEYLQHAHPYTSEVVLQNLRGFSHPEQPRGNTAKDLTNPKDLLGQKKVSLTKIPPAALAHCADAMMDGTAKYSKYNWREKHVQAEIYVDACLRHLLSWYDGEEVATDSGVHHLGHAMACCAILLDAQANGCMVDNRPNHGGAFLSTLEDIKLRRLNGT